MSGIAYETNEINSYELVLFTQAQYPTMKKGGMEVIFDLPGHSKPLSADIEPELDNSNVEMSKKCR